MFYTVDGQLCVEYIITLQKNYKTIIDNFIQTGYITNKEQN